MWHGPASGHRPQPAMTSQQHAARSHPLRPRLMKLQLRPRNRQHRRPQLSATTLKRLKQRGKQQCAARARTRTPVPYSSAVRSCHGGKECAAVGTNDGQAEESTGSVARKLVAVTGGRAGIARLANAPRPGWELRRQWSVPSSHACPIHRQPRSASVEATLTPRSSSM